MLNNISAEINKLKRKKIWIFPLIDAIIIVLPLLVLIHQSKTLSAQDAYFKTYPVLFFCTIILLSLFAFIIFHVDFKNNMLKQIFTCSIKPLTYIGSKLFVIFFMAVTLIYLSAIEIVLFALFSNGRIQMSWMDIAFICLMSFIDSVLIFSALIPVFFVIVLFKKSEVLSVFFTLLYPLLLIMATMGRMNVGFLNNIHPLLSAGIIHNVLMYTYIPPENYGIQLDPTLNPMTASINIILSAFIFLLLSVKLVRLEKN